MTLARAHNRDTVPLTTAPLANKPSERNTENVRVETKRTGPTARFVKGPGGPGNHNLGNKSVFSYTNIKNPVKISSCSM